MSAETLRRAAALMRKRAEASRAVAIAHPEETGGPDARYAPAFIEDAFRNHAPVDPPYSAGLEAAWEADGDHYASWHPAVVLAVADLLDNEASLIAGTESHPDLHMPLNGARCDLLLAVARAYLGEAS